VKRWPFGRHLAAIRFARAGSDGRRYRQIKTPCLFVNPEPWNLHRVSYQLTIPRLLGYLGFSVWETEVKEVLPAALGRHRPNKTPRAGSAGNQADLLTVHLYCGVHGGRLSVE